MPYRRAHWWLIALALTIPLAFWPGYFSPTARRTPALHAHAFAATLWLLLLIVQSWSASSRRLALHRASGRALFAAVPMFAAAGAGVIITMARGFADGGIPFYAENAARLVFADTVALVTFVILVAHAVAERRRVRLHAAAMLSTPLLVLPPVAGRLMGFVPGYPLGGAFGVSGFVLSVYLADLLTIAIAAWLWNADRRHGGAFVAVIVASVIQALGFATVGGTDAWEQATRATAALPIPPTAAVAAILAGAALWVSWGRPAAPARPAVG
ncbi:hypothetical protein GGQ80_000322 [Sphingomonas jinjuensis]|uniref:Uncharacterized protein n=1 Tax=Sphingomonas jinjuensis TaxID=535907 RepID=A0A840F812_9SPHN|nr:hypothetical protein [Sphingomonas jinjuensis]MBB4152446.1 hypothetical protein [Sphingomonas jinjuensis]